MRRATRCLKSEDLEQAGRPRTGLFAAEEQPVFATDRLVTECPLTDRQVRTGIDAPDEFRIVRGELDQWSEPAVPDFQRRAPNVGPPPLPR